MRNKVLSTGLSLMMLTGAVILAAKAAEAEPVQERAVRSQSVDELLRMAWVDSSKANYTQLEAIVSEILLRHEQEAIGQSATLKDFPPRDKVENYKTMSHVATALFIQAEAWMHQGRNDEAVDGFKRIIKQFPFAQSWDASRGSYWSIAEKSQNSIDRIHGVEGSLSGTLAEVKATRPVLSTKGTEAVVDYRKYGVFSGIGTKNYQYAVSSPMQLSKVVGEGVFPNTADILKNQHYAQVYKEGRLSGTHWDYVNTKDLEAAYFKWATAPEAPGLKLFYTALTFEKAGMLMEAIKTYHALIVNFPRTTGMTYWHTPWYPAQAAVGKIHNILRQNPALGLEYVEGKVRVLNGNDNSTINDEFIVWPGVIQKKTKSGGLKRKLGKPLRTLGGSKTSLVQYESGAWRMMVDGKPYIIKGLTYMPTKVGQSPDQGTIENWMAQDSNHNGKPDSPYDSWMDRNRNGVQDPDEPVIGDFQLMKEMGVNTLRLYNKPHPLLKPVMRELYDRFGIRVILSNFLGKYTIGSGADWASGTDYENEEHQKQMLMDVEEMVSEYKDEPYVLFWMLGNENNYGVASNGDTKPDAYFQFANRVAKRIKEIDPSRPVAVCNGDTLFVDKFAKNAPDIDIFGANVYRGDYGFASFWDEVRTVADKPAFITEYGAPAYSKQVSLEEAEEEQASYLKGAWLDIMANSAEFADGEGNAIGGVAFEWMDEWWKNYSPTLHDTKADVVGPFVGGYYFEEWFGFMSQGDGKQSPFLRMPRKSYEVYKGLWGK